MASISLFNSNSALSTLPANFGQNIDSVPTASASRQAKTVDATAASNSQNDTVKLSEAAQAKLLHSQGQSVSNIANTLGTTTKNIDTDLGITLEKEIEKTLEETVSTSK